MQARGARVLVTVSLLFGALVATSAPAASVTADSTISYVSEPGDWVGQGGSDSFTPADSEIRLNGDAHQTSVFVSRGGRALVLAQISAAPGRRLSPGIYEGATRASFNVGNATGIAVSVFPFSCNQVFGRLVINQLFFDSADQPLLLDADLEQHCEAANAPELRTHVFVNNLADANPPSASDDAFDVESDTTLRLTNPQLLSNDRDPDPGDSPTSIQVATSPSHGSLVSTAGGLEYTPDPAYDGYDAFTYLAVDTTDRASAPATVTLTVGTPPQDLFSYSGDTGEPISHGLNEAFNHSDSTFHISGARQFLWLTVQGHSEDWTIRLVAPAGSDLAPASYDNVNRDPTTGQPILDVFANGTGCNATFGNFTINAIGFDADGTPNMLDADLEQHCESPTAPALRASIRYHIPAVRPATNTDEFAAQGHTDVPSPGVLGNDTDADPRNTLTSSLMSKPQHGSVTLDATGAFSYQPAPGFAGDDHFVYRAADPFGLKSVPTIVTMHTTLPPAADTVWIHGVNGSATAYVIGGPITGGDVRMTTRSGIALLNGTVTLPDGLGGSATITFTTQTGSVAGSVIGTVTVDDPLLGGTSRFRVTVTRSAARHRAGGHALRISGSVARLTFSAHDRVTPPA